MWDLIVKTLQEMREQTRYVCFHNPDQELDLPENTGIVRFVPSPQVPLGQVWLMHDQPSGRIVMEF